MSEDRRTWSGWRNRTVRVREDPATPLLLQVRGGITSNFYFHAAAGDRPHVETLVVTHGRRRLRVVLPAGADGFSVRRRVAADGAGGFQRWRARLIDPDSLPTLSSEERAGKWTETFGYFQAKRYYEHARAFYYEFDDSGQVSYHPATGGKPVEIPYGARTKGTIPLPHHGYITVSSMGKWRVSIT
ncbi:hypothetical protein [Streptomyces sp. NPDC006368]|uniref:hypothetical protein n=1 Tax=Streptomyces sp. NPDC006368 TaxID=3156760 RepID=UPI0033BF0CDD